MITSEDLLTDELSGKARKRFLQYVDAWASVNGESTLDSFITGFRLGAQFTFDTFVTSKAPYADYLKDEICRNQRYSPMRLTQNIYFHRYICVHKIHTIISANSKISVYHIALL